MSQQLQKLYNEIKTEIINGIEMMSPPAYSNHTHVKGNVDHIFRTYLKGNVCIPICDGEKLVLEISKKKGDYVVPDFFVICDRSKQKKDGVYGAPDLIVEVLSPGTAEYDRGEKKELYQLNDVKEYWIIEPNNRSIEVYLLKDGVYKLDALYRLPDEDEPEEFKENAKTSFSVGLFPDMKVNLEDVFEYVNTWE